VPGISNPQTRLQLRTRLLLIFELVFGLAPVTIFYLYHFPVGLFWIGRVLELAGEGIGNAYTSGIAIAFAAGGVGLLGVWAALVGRLIGLAASNRFVLAGVSLAVLTGVGLMVFLLLAEAWWPEYYLIGAPLIVAIHQICALVRSTPPRLESATT